MNSPEIAVLVKEKQNLEVKYSHLENKYATLEKQNQHYKEEYDRLLHLIKISNRNQFGSKSEKIEQNNQGKLFETDEVTVVESETEKTETINYTRKKKNSHKRLQGHIPTKEIIIEVKQEDRICSCGCQKQLVRYEISKKVHFVPAMFELIETKREILACPKGCEQSLVTAELPKTALPKVCATEDLLGYIAVSKILDRQPLYHLEKQFAERNGVNISRQMMARWLIKLIPVFQPLLNLMKESLLSYDITSFDATTFQILKELNRPPNRKSYAYCFRGGPPGKEVVLYEYVAEAHKKYLKDYFDGYEGTLQVDADPLFEDLPLDGLKKLSYCNTHARRKFVEIIKVTKNDGLATEAVEYYRRVYEIEKKAKTVMAENKSTKTKEELVQIRYEIRINETKPIMKEFKIWLDKYKETVLPKSPLSKAINYVLNHWEGLNRFLDDGRLEADNNLTEQQIKYFVMGRKNFLFADTVDGAEAVTTLYSILLSAKVHKLNPLSYITTVLKQLPHCQNLNDYEKLLPWNIPLVGA